MYDYYKTSGAIVILCLYNNNLLLSKKLLKCVITSQETPYQYQHEPLQIINTFPA